MSSMGTIVIVVLAAALFVAAVVLLRSRNAHPWAAIVVAMLASGVCFTVGGESAEDAASPSIATVVAGIVGTLSVVAAIIALAPRSGDAPASRVPMLLAAGGIAIGAAGLLLNQMAS
jgi:drug/metabolite transporter (DMT)-like permease